MYLRVQARSHLLVILGRPRLVRGHAALNVLLLLAHLVKLLVELEAPISVRANLCKDARV